MSGPAESSAAPGPAFPVARRRDARVARAELARTETADSAADACLALAATCTVAREHWSAVFDHGLAADVTVGADLGSRSVSVPHRHVSARRFGEDAEAPVPPPGVGDLLRARRLRRVAGDGDEALRAAIGERLLGIGAAGQPVEQAPRRLASLVYVLARPLGS